jgi:hypothetical protein
MIELHPQYIKDTAGSELVILSKKEFDYLLEELDDLEDIALYEEALLEDDGERIPINKAFEMIEEERAKIGR